MGQCPSHHVKCGSDGCNLHTGDCVPKSTHIKCGDMCIPKSLVLTEKRHGEFTQMQSDVKSLKTQNNALRNELDACRKNKPVAKPHEITCAFDAGHKGSNHDEEHTCHASKPKCVGYVADHSWGKCVKE